MTFGKGKSLFLGIVALFTLLAAVEAQNQFTAPLSNTDKSERIAREMELYYLKPEMKSPYERVEFENGVATFTIWRDLPGDPQAEKTECAGYEWLLSGRGQKMGDGARSIFQRYPDVNALQLQFIELEFKSKKVDGKGKLQKETTAKIYLRMTADRSSILNSKTSDAELKKLLWKDTATCLRVGRELISKREVYL